MSHFREIDGAFRLPCEADVQKAHQLMETEALKQAEETVQPELDERLEKADGLEMATRRAVEALMRDACGYVCHELEEPVPLAALCRALGRLGYARSVPYSREGLLAAVQDGAYVLLYLPQMQLNMALSLPLEGGGSHACQVVEADEEKVTFRDYLAGALRTLTHDEIALLYPGAQVVEVYK